ncbi:hypothetical protein CDEN61S_00465 [Castellaniella denitrificans]
MSSPSFPGPIARLLAVHAKTRRHLQALAAGHASASPAAVAWIDGPARGAHDILERRLFPALIESMAGSDAVCLKGMTGGLARGRADLDRPAPGRPPRAGRIRRPGRPRRPRRLDQRLSGLAGARRRGTAAHGGPPAGRRRPGRTGRRLRPARRQNLDPAPGKAISNGSSVSTDLSVFADTPHVQLPFSQQTVSRTPWTTPHGAPQPRRPPQ